MRHLALAMLLILTLLSGGCGEAEPAVTLELELTTPQAPDPFQGLSRLRLTAGGPGLTPIAREVPLDARVLELPPIPLGADRRLVLEGLDAQGRVLARGSSAGFTLGPLAPERITIYFACVERFSLTGARLLEPRSGHTTTVLRDGRLLVAGGRGSNDQVLASVEIYDPQQQQFAPGPPLAQARAGHRAALTAHGDVLFVGGSDGTEAMASVELYAPEAGTSQQLSLAVPRLEHVALPLSDGTVLVAGGAPDKTKVDLLSELIDPAAGRVAPGPAGGPGQPAVVGLVLGDGRALVAGGIKTPPGQACPDSFLYTPAAARWEMGPRLLEGRSGAVGILLSTGEALLVGGESPSGPASSALLLSAGSFQGAGQTQASYRQHAAAPLAEGALVAGGSDTVQAEVFDSRGFHGAGELNLGRQEFTLTPLADGTVIAIGGRSGETAIADVEIFTPR